MDGAKQGGGAFAFPIFAWLKPGTNALGKTYKECSRQ
jgi:hypothetical protein